MHIKVKLTVCLHSDLDPRAVCCAFICPSPGSCAPSSSREQRSVPHPHPGWSQVQTSEGKQPILRHWLSAEGHQWWALCVTWFLSVMLTTLFNHIQYNTVKPNFKGPRTAVYFGSESFGFKQSKRKEKFQIGHIFWFIQ